MINCTIKADLMKKMMKANLVHLTKKDIKRIFGLGKEVSFKPKKGKLAEGAILFFKGNNKLTLDKIHKNSQKATSHCKNKKNILFAVQILPKNQNKLITCYIY